MSSSFVIRNCSRMSPLLPLPSPRPFPFLIVLPLKNPSKQRRVEHTQPPTLRHFGYDTSVFFCSNIFRAAAGDQSSEYNLLKFSLTMVDWNSPTVLAACNGTLIL